MDKDEIPFSTPPVPANDNSSEPSPFPSAKLDEGLKRIARLIGRQMAREAFETREVANDNAPFDD